MLDQEEIGLWAVLRLILTRRPEITAQPETYEAHFIQVDVFL
jgi:hypothetical protein